MAVQTCTTISDTFRELENCFYFYTSKTFLDKKLLKIFDLCLLKKLITSIENKQKKTKNLQKILFTVRSFLLAKRRNFKKKKNIRFLA